ncbi:unnamed protein product [Paramecium octaurelia]|uniref:Transmembrane protein n=1 Tax=Paramecium octaurelia TaxID=43137 RepID=A0A8S1WQY7_PAROT|nr:unnamed protein product [Paramecium octaurelia]
MIGDYYLLIKVKDLIVLAFKLLSCFFISFFFYQLKIKELASFCVFREEIYGEEINFDSQRRTSLPSNKNKRLGDLLFFLTHLEKKKQYQKQIYHNYLKLIQKRNRLFKMKFRAKINYDYANNKEDYRVQVKIEVYNVRNKKYQQSEIFLNLNE